MEFIETELKDVILIKPQVFGDDRGFFMETYNEKEFKANGLEFDFVQDNVSRSRLGTLRGLHYQLPPHAQGKLVRVSIGKVFDVAVDIRRSSPTFGQWVGVELSEDNKHMLWIPPGFAHGFYVMSPMAEFCYKCTSLYAPHAEAGIVWDDPGLKIDWPIVDDSIILSNKDKLLPPLEKADLFE